MLSEGAIKTALRAWQAAQAKPDRAAYAQFYADHFGGLLESGASVSHVDRAGWLRAHETSLTLPVAGTGTPHVELGAGGARLSLGPLEMFWVASNGGPKIAWQAPAVPEAVALREQPGLWLADENGALLSATPDPAWATGAPSLLGTTGATRGVVPSRLPRALRAWLGRRVTVLGAGGAMCETRLQRFVLRARITPELRTAEHWEGCADGPATPPAAMAADIWALSERSGRALVAEFSAPCKGALLAVDPDLPQPTIAAPEPANAELGAELLSAFRRLPAYGAIQARFQAEHPERGGGWDDHDARRSVSSLTLPGHAPLYFVSVAVGPGCASFSASLSAIWENGPDQPGQVLTAIDHERLTPSAVFDWDGSGSAVLLGPDGLFQARSVVRRHPPSSTRFEREFLSSVPFFAGPC